MNTSKLKGAMAWNGLKNEDLSKLLGINPTTLSFKIQGKREFTRDEIEKLIEKLQLTREEAFEIFFEQLKK